MRFRGNVAEHRGRGKVHVEYSYSHIVLIIN